MTKPQNWTVKRSREDFKQFIEALAKDIPKKDIDHIYKNDMELASIELFFSSLSKDQELVNHSLVKYFLSEVDEEKFKKTLKSGQGFLEAIVKLVNVEDHKIKEMKLEEPSKSKLVDKTDEIRLNQFLDSVKEVQACKMECYDQILGTVSAINSKYSEVCALIFKLADQIGVLTAKTKEMENLCSENLKDSVCQSQTYNMMKVALYSWSHEISQSKGNLSKYFVPLIKRLKTNSSLIDEVSSCTCCVDLITRCLR